MFLAGDGLAARVDARGVRAIFSAAHGEHFSETISDSNVSQKYSGEGVVAATVQQTQHLARFRMGPVTTLAITGKLIL